MKYPRTIPDAWFYGLTIPLAFIAAAGIAALSMLVSNPLIG